MGPKKLLFSAQRTRIIPENTKGDNRVLTLPAILNTKIISKIFKPLQILENVSNSLILRNISSLAEKFPHHVATVPRVKKSVSLNIQLYFDEKGRQTQCNTHQNSRIGTGDEVRIHHQRHAAHQWHGFFALLPVEKKTEAN
jgi:hypothetical protein